MSLLIHNVLSCSSKIDFSYLDGTASFGYNVSNTYTIDISDVQFFDGDIPLLSGEAALKEAYMRPNLVARIGTDEFINGRITNLSLPSSSLSGSSTATITIEESKKLDSYANNVFAQNIPSPHLLDSFQENFSFSRSEDSYSYTRTVSIKYKQGIGDQFLNHAHFFLKNFYFVNRPNFGYAVDGISENARTDSGFKPLLTESYDLIDLSVSLTENFESSSISGDVSVKKSYNIGINESGFTEKKYTIEIKALKEPLEIVANNACADILDNLIYENSSFNNPVSIEKGINKDGGIISLSVEFSNDPSKSETNKISYTVTKTKRDAFYDYTLSINFSSLGKSYTERFIKTKTLWKGFQSSIKTKIQTMFPEANPIYEKSHSTTFAKLEGKISESVVYTDDPAYIQDGLPENALKLKVTNKVTEQNSRFFRFLNLLDLKEKFILSELPTIGEGSISIEIVTKTPEDIFGGYKILQSMSFLNGNQYPTSDVITIDTANGATTRVIGYVFYQ